MGTAWLLALPAMAVHLGTTCCSFEGCSAQLRGAEGAFARARKARAAYLGLCRESYLHFLDDLSQAGWTGKYYADRIKGMDADIDQMRRSCAELLRQGKRRSMRGAGRSRHSAVC